MNNAITVHTLVQNEENFLWFSVMSVIDYVDKVFIWDTGSNDKTVEIIKEIEKAKPGKVYFKQMGQVNKSELSVVRQKMLDETESDWFILVDGDEVWWDDSVKKLTEILRKNVDSLETVVVPFRNLVGDIYHIQDEVSGRYSIDGKVGNITIRAINKKIPGLRVTNSYPLEGYFDGSGIEIQKRNKDKRKFLDLPYLHFTHLKRSRFDNEVMQGKRKLRYELGITVPYDFYYPEVFFRKRPNTVSNPWVKMSNDFLMRSLIETPFKKIGRRLWTR